MLDHIVPFGWIPWLLCLFSASTKLVSMKREWSSCSPLHLGSYVWLGYKTSGLKINSQILALSFLSFYVLCQMMECILSCKVLFMTKTLGLYDLNDLLCFPQKHEQTVLSGLPYQTFVLKTSILYGMHRIDTRMYFLSRKTDYMLTGPPEDCFIIFSTFFHHSWQIIAWCSLADMIWPHNRTHVVLIWYDWSYVMISETPATGRRVMFTYA